MDDHFRNIQAEVDKIYNQPHKKTPSIKPQDHRIEQKHPDIYERISYFANWEGFQGP